MHQNFCLSCSKFKPMERDILCCRITVDNQLSQICAAAREIECLESSVQFVVARRDTAKLFETSEEPFNEISTSINMFVITSGFDTIGFRRYNRRGLHCLDHRQKAVG
jgi:hypothetical protein